MNLKSNKFNRMKKSIVLSMILFLALGLMTGCSKLDITEEFDIEITFVANSSTAAYDDEVVFDATESSDIIADYANKIKEIEILDVTVRLTSFSGPDDQKIILNTLSVANEDGDGETTVGTVADVLLKPLLDTEMPVTIEQAGIDRFCELIKDSPHKALVMNAGSASSVPIDFVCVFTFRVKMTANPL